MTSKLKEYTDFKPFYKNKKDEVVYYETSFYCQSNYSIHPNLKSAINCPNCFTDEERLMFKSM